MKSILKYLLVSLAMAAGDGGEDAGAHGKVAHAWDYKTNGADWAGLTIDGKVNMCKQSTDRSWNQSPIDLRNDWPHKSAAFDNFNKVYSNIDTHNADSAVKPKAEVVWNGHTSQVDFPTGNL